MANLDELEARIKVLQDTEAIKKLKHKYFRCLDNQQWDELRECFASDATSAYDDGRYSQQGIDAIMNFLIESLGSRQKAGVMGVHLGHHPEIELTSATTAKGTWTLHSFGIDSRAKTSYRMGAYYHDEYVKIDGAWKIKHTGYSPLFRVESDVPGLNVLVGFEAD